MEIAITVATVLQKIRGTYDLVAAKASLPKQLKNSLSTLLLLEVNATQLIGSNRLPDRSLRCLQEVVTLLQTLERETEAHVSQHKLRRMLKMFSNRPKKILQQIKDVNDRLELLGRIKTLAIESSNFDSANLLKNADSYAVEFWDRFFGSQVYSVAIPDFVSISCAGEAWPASPSWRLLKEGPHTRKYRAKHACTRHDGSQRYVSLWETLQTN